MKYLHPVALTPNELIEDTTLHYSTKAVAMVLLFLAGRKNRSVRVSFAQLGTLAHCSTTTAQQAIRELLQGGYLCKGRRHYRYDAQRKRMVYAANTYTWLRRNGGYSMIRREILEYPLSAASFSALLYLYRCAGRSGRAFPSLRRIAAGTRRFPRGLEMAKSTVCLALRALRRQQALIRHRCKTLCGCHAANSYYLTDMVLPAAPNAFPSGGSPIFDKLPLINQITMGSYSREKKSGVTISGNLRLDLALFPFDGTGVRVRPAAFSAEDPLLA